MQKHRSIRNFLISPSYQFRFIFWAVFACLCLIFYFTAILYSSIRQYHLAIMTDLPPAMSTDLEIRYSAIIARLSAGSLTILVICVVVGVVISHKTAGPLYQLRNVFDKVLSGDLAARVKFRKEDEFPELAESFNAMMDEVQKKLGSGKSG